MRVNCKSPPSAYHGIRLCFDVDEFEVLAQAATVEPIARDGKTQLQRINQVNKEKGLVVKKGKGGGKGKKGKGGGGKGKKGKGRGGKGKKGRGRGRGKAVAVADEADDVEEADAQEEVEEEKEESEDGDLEDVFGDVDLVNDRILNAASKASFCSGFYVKAKNAEQQKSGDASKAKKAAQKAYKHAAQVWAKSYEDGVDVQ